MEQNSLPRVTVAFFGKRNAGKSSLVNAFTSQDLSIVSDVKGTTTDPVKKTMELLPLGPVVIIDTPGIDDEGELGKQRVEKARRILDSVQIAVLVKDCREKKFSPEEKYLLDEFKNKKVPYVIALNKCDLSAAEKNVSFMEENSENCISVSALCRKNIEELKNKVASLRPERHRVPFVKDLLSPQDIAVLVIPIDKAAPEGRLILPQQIALRDILDAHAVPVCTSVENLNYTLENLKQKPAMVITDSQAFAQVSKIVPEEIPLTSFSILMSRFKGTLEHSAECVKKIDELKNGNKILISEGCTHHRQCGDIGTQKIPALLKKYTGLELAFDFTSGGTFPEDLSSYALVIHCGGCMLNEKEMQSREAYCRKQEVPFTNYGMAIAFMNGILKRTLEIPGFTF